MVKKANIQWTAKQLAKMLNKGSLNFDNSVQRSFVWDDKRKSLLIHSLIVGYPVPPFFTIKTDNGYSCLDGRQRSTTIKQFINDEFTLVDVPEIEIEGDIIDINGMKFSELSEDFQEEINGYSLTVYFFDNSITEEEINELFFRLNNGKPLTTIELTRVKAKSIETIKRIGKHELFYEALTEKAINKYTNEDIIIKTWAVLYSVNPSMETKYIRPLMEKADITEKQEKDINIILNRIQEAYAAIKQSDDKIDIKITKRMLTRTHLISIIPITLKSINEGVTLYHYIKWLKDLFSGAKSATNIQEYNDNASSGSAKAEAVRTRLNAIEEHFNNFISKSEVNAND